MSQYEAQQKIKSIKSELKIAELLIQSKCDSTKPEQDALESLHKCICELTHIVDVHLFWHK